jgi:4-hydroxybenzoate polyprenyltransferase
VTGASGTPASAASGTVALPRRGFGPYLLHLRPAEWPSVAAHSLLGWFLAAGLRVPTRDVWLGLAVWTVALNGGTLALNSAFDRDTGAIAFLRRPPPVPRGLAVFATILMAFGLGLTWHLGPVYRALYLVCVVLSLAYSVPPIRLKAVGGLDWAINMLGFGTLTPYAIWSITGIPLHGPRALLLWGFAPLFGALYPLTQLYQMDDDRTRGDETLALRLGVRSSLVLAARCTVAAFLMFATAGWLTGWRTGGDLVRWAVLGVAALAWAAVLVPWVSEGTQWSSADHHRGMHYALVAWALTDAAVFLAWTV